MKKRISLLQDVEVELTPEQKKIAKVFDSKKSKRSTDGHSEKGGKVKERGLNPYSTTSKQDVERAKCFIDLKDSQSSTSNKKGK